MGLANWFVGKMVDRFLAQPPEVKAAMFDTVARRFWEAATPEETARIAELMLPRFLEAFLDHATTEQKLALMHEMISAESLQEHVGRLAPGLFEAAVKGLSDGERQDLVRSMVDPEAAATILQGMLPSLLEGAVKQMPAEAMQRILGSLMPGFGSPGASRSRESDADRPRPPRGPGGMMPW